MAWWHSTRMSRANGQLRPNLNNIVNAVYKLWRKFAKIRGLSPFEVERLWILVILNI